MGFNPGKLLKKARKAIEKGARNVGKAAEKAAQDVGKTAEKAVRDTTNVVVDAHVDAANVVGKAHEDAARATVKAAKDTLDAAKATARYLESKGRSFVDAAARAERLAREGKVLDAFWHASVDPLVAEEQNALRAMQESHVIRTICQVGASAYGPGGAAAFAAWYTYRTTGNAEMAIRVGVISGATSAGLAATGQLPVSPAVKAAIAGAIGGLAVAASGGDAKAVREGFLRAGGMVLIQDGYREFTQHDLDPHGATKGPIESSALDDDCYVRDQYGDIVSGPDNRPLIDYTVVDGRYSFVGRNALPDPDAWLDTTEHGVVMRGAGQIPGMNAMALFHDHWVATWQMNYAANVATIPPAIVLTYMGTDSHVLEEIRKAALAEAAANAATLPKPVPAVLAVPPPAAPKPAPKPKPKPPRDRPDPPGANR